MSYNRSSNTSSALISASSGASSQREGSTAQQMAPQQGEPVHEVSPAIGPPADPLSTRAEPLLEGLPSDLQEQVQLLLTGDADIDRDIIRFYRARHAMGG